MRIGWAVLAMSVAAPAAAATGDVAAGSAAWAKGDYRAAVAQWRGPAVAGDPVAQFNLAQAYKLGRGVPVDPAQAQIWFRRAAEKGLPQAEDNYGLALFQAGDRAGAAPWLEKAAARGEPRCQLVLGTMLFNGDGIARDYPRAYALVTRAAAAGLRSASETLAQMDGYISPADRERGTALAQRYALDLAARPAPATPGVVRVTEQAPSRAPIDTPRPKPSLTAAAAQPQPKAAPSPKPHPGSVAAPGKWKAQLGAFKDRGNAEALWARVKARMGDARATFTTANGLTRLQASGFASRADAEAACRRAGLTNCLVTGG